MVEDEADDPIDDDKSDNDKGVDHLGNKLHNLRASVARSIPNV